MNDFREVTEQVRGTDEPRTDGFLPRGLGTAHVLHTNSRQTQETRSSAQPSHVLSGDLDYLPVSGPQFPHLWNKEAGPCHFFANFWFLVGELCIP